MTRSGKIITGDKLLQLQTPNSVMNRLIDTWKSARDSLSIKSAKEEHGITQGELRVVIGG